jgi:hypothetical protein
MAVTETTGSIRPARITDRQALNELSRRVHLAPDSYRRSLGVPAPSTGAGRFRLATHIPSWLPLRSPSVHLVMEMDGELVGSCRAVEEPRGDDWVIIELEAVDTPAAAEIRFALLEAVVEAGAGHNVTRFHAACSDVRDNLEIFSQQGFMSYAQEEILYRPPEPVSGPRSWLRRLLSHDGQARGDGRSRSAEMPTQGDTTLPPIQPAGAPDAWHLFDLWTHCTPPAIARVEGYGAADWESVGHEATVPRSSLSPLMHFSGVDAWLMPQDQRAAGFAQHAACRHGPHYLRHLIRDGADGAQFLRSVLRSMGDDAIAAGILSPVRTYESMGMRAATAMGFEPVGRVTLLVREVRATVRQPALVPAIHP